MDEEEREAFERERAEQERIVTRQATQQQAGGFSKFIKKLQTPSQKVSQRLPRATRIQDAKLKSTVKKAVHILAPKGSFAKRVTQTSKKGTSRGRGRPHGTYKVKILPISGRPVKVSTAVYKKMASIEKKTYRLRQAQRRAQMILQSEQVAAQQDLRYQPSGQEQFLAEPDREHEMKVALAQQQAERDQYQPQQPQKQSFMQKAISGVSAFGAGISRLGQPRQRQITYDEYGRPIQVQPQQPPQQIVGGLVRQPTQGGIVREPKITLFGGRSNLLNIPNQFNRPKNSTLAIKRKRIQ